VLLALVIMIGQSHESSAQSPTCEGLFQPVNLYTNTELRTEDFHGKSIQFREIVSSSMRDGFVRASELNPRNAFFIGIQSNGHAYLLKGAHRIDTSLFYGRPVLRDSNNVSFTTGFIMRIEDPSGETLKRLSVFFRNQADRERAQRSPRALTCVSGVCKILRSHAKVRLDGWGPRLLKPETFFRRLVLGAITDQKGKPLSVDLFMLGYSSLAQFEETLIRSRED